MHNVLIISYIAFPIGKLFILPESDEMSRDFLKNYPVTRPPELGTALPYSPPAPIST